ncbi:MAG TPA: hypothetical protein VGK38_08600 [Prolixibacteraceae bacterium]|jgi:hypothetical protein
MKRVKVVNGRATIKTKSTVLVLHTDNPDLLPRYNEYTLAVSRSLPSAGTYTFTNNYDTETGILNLNKSWIVIYDPTNNYVDFFLFTHKPTRLDYTVNSLGVITQLILWPGNGLIYHGQIIYPNLTFDSNSDLIPDFLDPTVNGSLSRFLNSYTVADGPQGIKIILLSTGAEIKTSNGKTLFVRG